MLHPIWVIGSRQARQPGPAGDACHPFGMTRKAPSPDHRSRHNHQIKKSLDALADYPLLEVVWSMFIFFAFVIWVYLPDPLLLADNFRRHDHSGLAKAG